MALSNIVVRILIPLFRFITVTPAECAEFMWDKMWTSDKKYQSGAHELDRHAEPHEKSHFVDDEVREKVWEHAVSMTGPKAT